MIAFWCLREITHRLHRSCANCGEPRSALVRRLSTGVLPVGNRGTNRPAHPQGPAIIRLSTAVHRLSTGYPPGLSPAVGTAPGCCRLVIPRTFNRPSTAVHRFPAQSSLCVAVHSGFPRRCPHLCATAERVIHGWGQLPGDNRWITLACHDGGTAIVDVHMRPAAGDRQGAWNERA